MTSSTQTILEAQQLLAWGNRVAARRHLTLALQENPHDAELWFWLTQTLDNQAHIKNALERALKYDPGLLEAQRYLDLLNGVMSNTQLLQTGRAPAIVPDSSQEALVRISKDSVATTSQDPVATTSEDLVATTSQVSVVAKKVSSSEEKRDNKGGDVDTEPLSRTIDVGLEANESAQLVEPEEKTTRKLAFVKVPSTEMDDPNGLTLLPEEDDQTLDGLESEEEQQEEARTGNRFVRALGCLIRVLLLLLLVSGLCLSSWYLLSNNLLPQQAVHAHPVIATQVAVARDTVPPFPTQLIVDPSAIFQNPTAGSQDSTPEWVGNAQNARYNNNFERAEEILRDGLESDPNNIAGLLALSDLLREQANGEKDALALAEQALEIINREGTLEQRAEGAQRYVWAMARQAKPDVGLALVSGEQAAKETPNNRHAQWAYAMAAALEGNASAALQATEQATNLSTEEPAGVVDAQQAEIYAYLGDLEEAARSYKAALEKRDYVPWRVRLVQILRELNRTDQAQTHIEHLRTIAPNDPAVQELAE